MKGKTPKCRAWRRREKPRSTVTRGRKPAGCRGTRRNKPAQRKRYRVCAWLPPGFFGVSKVPGGYVFLLSVNW